jgi:hypothetical protein
MRVSSTVIYSRVVPSVQSIAARAASARVSWPTAMASLAKAAGSLDGGLTQAGSLGGCTGDLSGGRPDDSEGGLAVLVSGGLRAMGGGATLLVAQCSKRLGADPGGLQGFKSCCLVASYSL